jgi:hypothetical protein
LGFVRASVEISYNSSHASFLFILPIVGTIGYYVPNENIEKRRIYLSEKYGEKTGQKYLLTCPMTIKAVSFL